MSTQKSPAPTSTKASTKAASSAAPKTAKTAAPTQAAPAPAAPAPAKPAKVEPVKAPAKAAPAVTAEDTRGNRRHLVGVVTSDKMNKTVVVQVTRRVREAKFGKYTVHQAKYKAHSEDNSVHVGDKVELVESRPLSKDKRWRVVRLVERARRTP